MNPSDFLQINLEAILQASLIQKVYVAHRNPLSDGKNNFSQVHRLAIPFSGCHRMTIADGRRVIHIHPRRFEATFMPKGSWNKPDWRLPVTVATFHFFPDITSVNIVQTPGATAEQLNVERIHYHPLTEDGRLLLEMLNKHVVPICKDSRIQALTHALLHCCLDRIRTGPSTAGGKAWQTYRNICTYLEETNDLNTTREQIARTFALTPNYLSALFKTQGRTTFNNYLNKLKISRAKRLLQQRDITLDSIAVNCGFSDTSYFCRIFKKHTGTTPTNFKNT